MAFGQHFDFLFFCPLFQFRIFQSQWKPGTIAGTAVAGDVWTPYHMGLSSARVKLHVDTWEVCRLLCFQDLLVLTAHTNTTTILPQCVLRLITQHRHIHLLPSCNFIVSNTNDDVVVCLTELHGGVVTCEVLTERTTFEPTWRGSNIGLCKTWLVLLVKRGEDWERLIQYIISIYIFNWYYPSYEKPFQSLWLYKWFDVCHSCYPVSSHVL